MISFPSPKWVKVLTISNETVKKVVKMNVLMLTKRRKRGQFPDITVIAE